MQIKASLGQLLCLHGGAETLWGQGNTAESWVLCLVPQWLQRSPPPGLGSVWWVPWWAVFPPGLLIEVDVSSSWVICFSQGAILQLVHQPAWNCSKDQWSHAAVQICQRNHLQEYEMEREGRQGIVGEKEECIWERIEKRALLKLPESSEGDFYSAQVIFFVCLIVSFEAASCSLPASPQCATCSVAATPLGSALTADLKWLSNRVWEPSKSGIWGGSLNRCSFHVHVTHPLLPKQSTRTVHSLSQWAFTFGLFQDYKETRALWSKAGCCQKVCTCMYPSETYLSYSVSQTLVPLDPEEKCSRVEAFPSKNGNHPYSHGPCSSTSEDQLECVTVPQSQKKTKFEDYVWRREEVLLMQAV